MMLAMASLVIIVSVVIMFVSNKGREKKKRADTKEKKKQNIIDVIKLIHAIPMFSAFLCSSQRMMVG